MVIGEDRKSIVITSIFPPTPAVLALARRVGWQLIVVGDRKSPQQWHLDGVMYLSVKGQSDSGFTIEPLLPYNHYARKNLGYLAAMRSGASVLLDTDDDNVPIEDGFVQPFDGEVLLTPANLGFVNVYRSFTAKRIWPRGFPLERISLEEANRDLHFDARLQRVRVGIWQGLANGDPDVDAIYRLTVNEGCRFEVREPIALGKGSFCPFNSQNTVFRDEMFPLLYLPSTVTFRFTDILRGLIAQPIIQLGGFQLGFHSATVVQDRNPHNYLKDFEDEIPCFLYAQRVVDIVAAAISPERSIAENLLVAYEGLVARGVVAVEELRVVSAWISDASHCLDERQIDRQR